ncbi:hypothetical protein [Actinoplanes derwentensis]|uniref:hypothetical protein n=1 Tax=Actinoplanes derwentensis TaxID=113562 RepID=UPI000B88DC08|nr:hypothetical protein [Actinoplanes derwentensis]
MKLESYNLAFAELRLGNRDQARKLLNECREQSGPSFVPYLAIGAAALAVADGDHPLAARMIGVADSAFAVAGEGPGADDAAELAKAHTAAVEALGEDKFADYRADGALWELDAVFAA